MTFAELGFFFTSFLFFGQKVDSGKVAGVILIGLVKAFVLRISYFDWAKCRTSVSCYQPDTEDIVSVGKRTSVPIQSPS